MYIQISVVFSRVRICAHVLTYKVHTSLLSPLFVRYRRVAKEVWRKLYTASWHTWSGAALRWPEELLNSIVDVYLGVEDRNYVLPYFMAPAFGLRDAEAERDPFMDAYEYDERHGLVVARRRAMAERRRKEKVALSMVAETSGDPFRSGKGGGGGLFDCVSGREGKGGHGNAASAANDIKALDDEEPLGLGDVDTARSGTARSGDGSERLTARRDSDAADADEDARLSGGLETSRETKKSLYGVDLNLDALVEASDGESSVDEVDDIDDLGLDVAVEEERDGEESESTDSDPDKEVIEGAKLNMNRSFRTAKRIRVSRTGVDSSDDEDSDEKEDSDGTEDSDEEKSDTMEETKKEAKGAKGAKKKESMAGLLKGSKSKGNFKGLTGGSKKGKATNDQVVPTEEDAGGKKGKGKSKAEKPPACGCKCAVM